MIASVFAALMCAQLSAAPAASPAEKSLPFPGEVFSIADRTAFVIPSTAPAEGSPWVWYAPTLPNLPGDAEKWMFEKFLDAGVAVAGIDVGESYGSPEGRRQYSRLFDEMVRRGYSARPVLLARSRGGLMTLAWAAENPGKVAAFAGVYPVCNLESYPGLKKAAPAFGLTTEDLKKQLPDHNPVDRLASLAEAGVPLFAVHGDIDQLVPLDANSGLVNTRYQELGGSMQLVVAPGQGHNMWTGFFQSRELVTFVLQHASAEKTPAPTVKTFVYKQSEGKPREVEVYFPPNHDPQKAKVPGLILFHGGGWTGGSLSQFRRACEYFASRGLVTATANYRMLTKAEGRQLPAGETRKRVCVTDAKSAIRWFKQHAEEFGIDPKRIITGGGSAGGHVSVLATTNPGLNDPSDPSAVDTSVVAYLLFNPAFAVDDSQDPEIDVLKHLHRGLAPSIVFFGTEDTWKVGWDAAYARLRELGHEGVNLQLAPGQAHSFFNKDPWQTLTLLAADRFLIEQGLLSGEPTLKAPDSGESLTSHPSEPRP